MPEPSRPNLNLSRALVWLFLGVLCLYVGFATYAWIARIGDFIGQRNGGAAQELALEAFVPTVVPIVVAAGMKMTGQRLGLVLGATCFALLGSAFFLTLLSVQFNF